MRFRVVLIAAFFIVAGIGAWELASKTEEAPARFEAHEFAVFRSEYETLKAQAPEKRVEHFRDLLETTESARLTPGMAETLADFCRKVATADEESPKVQAEARLVLRSLEPKFPSRAPASVDSKESRK